MEELTRKTTIWARLAAWFRLCPARHVLTAAGGLMIAAYFALRGNAALMEAVSRGFVRPYHRFLTRLTAPLPFSVAECLIVAGVLSALAYLVFTAVQLVRRPQRGRRVYRLCLTIITAFALIYGGFCLFWGVYYYTSDFEVQSGIAAKPHSVEQLEAVTTVRQKR